MSADAIYDWSDDPDWDMCDICHDPIDYCQGHGELI